METELQEIVTAADAWFGTGSTRRKGPEYARFEKALRDGRDALMDQRQSEVTALSHMDFDADRQKDLRDGAAETDDEE